jgi:hypothetical protein
LQAAQRETDNTKAAIAALDDLLSTSGLRPRDVTGHIDSL